MPLDKNGFDLWADGYDKAAGLSDEQNVYPFAGYKETLGRVYAAVMEKPGASVLDIGFGTGTLTAKLYGQGCEISGQDFSPRMREIASAKMPRAHLYGGDFSKGLAGPLARRRYDFIIATYSLHHLTDEQKRRFIPSLIPLLKENGRLIIGDIAFPAREDMERCRLEAGEAWDDEEYYFVAEEWAKAFPGFAFTQVSKCAGILTFSF